MAKVLDGKYYLIINYNTEDTTCGCEVEIYNGVLDRINGELPTNTKFYSWKGEDFFSPTDENDFYEKLDGDYFPDKEDMNYPRVYEDVKFIIKSKHFHDINYDTEIGKKLTRTNTFVKGELQKVEYFSDVDKTNKVLVVDISYTRDDFGFATKRTTTRTWVGKDDTLHPVVKITTKYYDTLSQIQEGKTRRGNIVDGLQMPILGMMLATITDKTSGDVIQMGRDFLNLYQASFQSFISESHKQIVTDMGTATDYWLDNVINAEGITIRQYVLNELNI